MRRVHQISGLVLVAVFLYTGSYMSAHQPPMLEIEAGARMVWRSRHIYILLAGLLNLSLGSYYRARTSRWRRIVQHVGSTMFLIAPVLLITAFFLEPASPFPPRGMSLPALFLLLTGALAHWISALGEKC